MTLPDELRKKWAEAERTGEPVALGDIVVCDACDADYTTRDDTGGFIFGSYAYCPGCALKAMPDIIRYGEQSHIRATCPEGESFADFIRKYRQKSGSTAIRIRSFG